VNYKRLNGREIARRFMLVFDMEDDVLQVLQRFCEREKVAAASISGIGGFRRAAVAYYDMEAKRYERIEIGEQVEVLSFLGSVTEYRENPKIHVHCIVGHRDGHTTGGHLLDGIVRPTLELIVEELSSNLHRTDRPEIGIPLIEL
jgi:predicted DNA-binding protein with PD1-like motif